jgi:hypothetical protein
MEYLNNLPPFYIGQKVISLSDYPKQKQFGQNTPEKDKEYTIRDMIMSDAGRGMEWCVLLVEVRNTPRQFNNGYGELRFVARAFVEPLTMTAKITLKEELVKVLERVDEFVTAN